MPTGDSLLLTLCLIVLVLILLMMIVWLVRLLVNQMQLLQIENQSLRNQLRTTTVGDLERIQRVTNPQPQPSSNSKQSEYPGYLDQSEPLNTPSGQQDFVTIGGIPVPLSSLDPALASQGWNEFGDEDAQIVNPDGTYESDRT